MLENTYVFLLLTTHATRHSTHQQQQQRKGRDTCNQVCELDFDHCESKHMSGKHLKHTEQIHVEIQWPCSKTDLGQFQKQGLMHHCSYVDLNLNSLKIQH